MIVLHFITMLVYLSSVITYYIYFAKWDDDPNDTDNAREENQAFCSWAICQILLTLVEFVLICLFWGVSKKVDPTSSDVPEEV